MANWVAHMVDLYGVWGIAFLMLLENLFPPIPSEVIMPLAGYTAALGQASIVLMIIAGTIGSLGGAAFWFLVARWFGEERLKRFSVRYGRILTLTQDEIDKADHWFDRYGNGAVLFGRLVPTIRTLISIPAGLSEMPWPRFLFYSAIGTFAWTAFLALAGYFLGSAYTVVEGWINPVSDIVVVLIVLIYLYRVVTFRRRVGNGAGKVG